MKQKAKHIAKKAIKYFLEISAGLVALMAICVVGIVLRLSHGPIPLDFFKPFVLETIQKSDFAASITFEESVLQWSEKTTSLQLVLSDISVFNENQLKLGNVKRLGFGISLRALLDGDIRVRDLVIYQPNLYILRNEQGEIHLDLQASGKKQSNDLEKADQQNNKWNLVTVLKGLATPYEQAKKPSLLNYLNSISVVDAEMRLMDMSTQQYWRLPKVNFVFAKIDSGFGGELDFDLESNDRVMNFKTQLLYKLSKEKDKDEIFWGVDVERFYLSDFIKRFDSLSFLEGTTLPLSLHSDVHFSADLKLLNLDMKGKAEKGDLQISDILENKVAIKEFEIEAHYNDEEGIAEIKKANLTLNEALFDVKASWDLNKAQNNVLVTSEFGGFSTKELYNVWPLVAAPGAREWAVSSISEGYVKEGGFKLDATLDLAHKDQVFEVDDFKGSFDYEGLSVKFLPEMPAVTELNGTADFDLNSLTFGVEFAMINDLVIGGGNVKIHNFDYAQHPIELLDINLSPVSGKISNIVTVLDKEPLNIVSRVNRKISDFDGDFKGDVFLSFPLDKDLKMEEVVYKGRASSQNLTVRNAFQDIVFEQGAVDISVDTKELVIKGQGSVDGEQVKDLYLKEDISGEQTPRTHVAFKSKMKTDKISRFTDVLDPYLSGKAFVEFDYKDNRKSGQKIQLKMDLTESHINLNQLLHYTKKEGESLDSSLVINLDSGGNLQKISSLKLSSKKDKVDVSGDIHFTKEGAVQKIKFPSLKIEENDFSLMGQASDLDPTLLEIDITGNSIDIAGLFENDDDFDIEKKQTEDVAASSSTAYEITIDTKNAYAVDKKLFEDFDAFIMRDKNKSIQVLELDTQVRSTESIVNPLKVRYTPQKLTAYTNDAGGVIERLGIYEDVKGGALYLKLLPKTDVGNVMEGQLLIKDMRAVKAPVIARILDAFSFDGISQLFDKEKKGLLFNRIATNVTWDKTPKKEVLKLREGKTKSESLGLTFDGNYYFTTGKAEINGTIVPVSDVNNFLASIPLIGDIITMGAGDSIFAATYTVLKKPDAKDVEVSVNPVAALAPGFLRTLFFEERFDEDTFNDQ